MTDEQAKLFLGRNYATLATVGRHGPPHLTVVWVDWDGERVLVNTAAGRVKERNLRRDPRASVLVADGTDPYRYVSVAGKAEIVEEGAARISTASRADTPGARTLDYVPASGA